MNNEQLKQNADAMLAFVDGQAVQCRTLGDDHWFDMILAQPSWSFAGTEYRRKPAPKTRPWNCPEDVPLDCWLDIPVTFAREEHQWHQVTGVSDNGICSAGGWKSWEELAKQGYRHSIDRKNPLPCVVTE